MSASEYTATVSIESSRQARMMRSAISPRLAIRRRVITTLSDVKLSTTEDTEERGATEWFCHRGTETLRSWSGVSRAAGLCFVGAAKRRQRVEADTETQSQGSGECSAFRHRFDAWPGLQSRPATKHNPVASVTRCLCGLLISVSTVSSVVERF